MRRAIVTAVVGMTMVGCTGGGKHPVQPSRPTITVLPSADRIRLSQTRLGGPPSCMDDEFCAAGISRVYGVDLGGRTVALSTPQATLGALDAGAVDLGVLPASALERNDPRITVLTDDRGLRRAENEVPIVSASVAKAGGASLTTVLGQIGAALDPAALAGVEQALAGGASGGSAADGWLQAHAIAGVPAPAAEPPIVIGARADRESTAIADIYSGALARAGWTATVLQLDGDRADELDALGGGRINAAVDTSGALLEHLAGFIGIASASETRTLALLKPRLADLGLVAMPPSGGSPGFVFAVSRAVATALNLSTMTDLARASGAHPAPTTSAPTTSAPTTTTTTPTAPSTTTSTTAPAIAAIGPEMGIGSSGPDVILLQERLTELGYPRVSTSGVFDEATRRAVVAFQMDDALVTTGTANAATQRALAVAHPTTHPTAVPAPGDADSVRVPPTTAPTIYLAFGGGPSPATAQVLDVLRRHSATATFFADDHTIGPHPESLSSAGAAGNGVGTSLDPHNAASPIALDAFTRTVARTQDDLAAVVGRTPTCVLAPYGAAGPAVRDGNTQRGWKTVLWDIDPQDWRRPGATAIAADVVNNARPGSIVLLHDGGGDRSQTVAALGTIIDTLAARGYRFAAIPDCLVGSR